MEIYKFVNHSYSIICIIKFFAIFDYDVLFNILSMLINLFNSFYFLFYSSIAFDYKLYAYSIIVLSKTVSNDFRVSFAKSAFSDLLFLNARIFLIIRFAISRQSLSCCFTYFYGSIFLHPNCINVCKSCL